MGDGFESDTMIYLTLYSILNRERKPWEVWNELRNTDEMKKFLSMDPSTWEEVEDK